MGSSLKNECTQYREARALIELHARDEGAVHVDAAEYPGDEKAYAAVAVKSATGTTKAAASVRTRKAHRAEEVAIARPYSATPERQSTTTPGEE